MVRFGIVGDAMATCVAYVIGNIIIINWYYYAHIGLDVPQFWKNILRMSPVMILMGTIWYFILDWIQTWNWLTFFALAIVYTVLYFILAYFFMMNPYERSIVKAPVQKAVTKAQKIIGYKR